MRRRLWVGAAAGAAGVALAAGACGGSDTPALSGPPAIQETPSTLVAGGPPIAVTTVGAVEEPVVRSGAGAAAISAAGKLIATRLSAEGKDCPMVVERSDPAVISLLWTCTDETVATGTWSVTTGQPYTLAGLLSGAWAAYLSATARAQLEAGGATAAQASAAAPASAAAFARWYVTPTTLEVSFPLPGGPVTVGFPLTTLVPYLPAGSPLTAR